MKHPSWLPSREALERSRWLRPFAHRLGDESLWRLTRHSVARAVAIGLFFGLLLPVAQIVFAVAVAMALRAHVAIAAACTLVTNPFTFPGIYWFAHWLGKRLLNGGDATAAADAAASSAASAAAAAHMSWFEWAWQWLQSAGVPLLTGLALLSVTAAVVGHALVLLFWRRPRAHDPH